MYRDNILQDALYSSMIQWGASDDQLFEAGWLNTGINQADLLNGAPSLFNTDGILPNSTVLLSTGSYAPAHSGHIDALLAAKSLLELEGHVVSKCIISPSHDEYVQSKLKSNKYPLSLRVKELHKFTKEFPFIDISTVEASIFKVSVNFSDIIMLIDKAISTAGINGVKIGYVFGSDHLAFADCFRSPLPLFSHIFGVCVVRQGYPVAVAPPNCVVVRNSPSSDLASRLIRSKASDPYAPKLPASKSFGVRNDTDFVTSVWGDTCQTSYLMFHSKLVSLFSKYLGTQVESIDLRKQVDALSSLVSGGSKVLNLDACTNSLNIAQFPLNLSRTFNISTPQLSPVRMDYRLNSDVLDLIPGDYTLVDDDIASGFTVRNVSEQLQRNQVNVINAVSLTSFVSKHPETPFFDLGDTRDFLAGAPSGGLVCSFKNSRMRVPYWHPWVDLSSRSSINYLHAMQFTFDVILLNLEFYDKNPELNVLNPFISHLGFRTPSSFCKHLISWYSTLDGNAGG